MKNRKSQLDVDFIGEQGHALTQEEQQVISNFIKAEKEKRAARPKRSESRRTRKPKQTT